MGIVVQKSLEIADGDNGRHYSESSVSAWSG